MATTLSDLQLVLLAAAAARIDGSLLPPPDSVAGQRARIRKAVPPLLKRALVTEVDVVGPTQAWREEADRHIGIVITDAGRTAIGVEALNGRASGAGDSVQPQPDTSVLPDQPEPASAPYTRPTKSAQVLALLRRVEGATLAELVAATDWLPHTTRAALTGLRKKGHGIARAKRGEATCYHLGEAA